MLTTQNLKPNFRDFDGSFVESSSMDCNGSNEPCTVHRCMYPCVYVKALPAAARLGFQTFCWLTECSPKPPNMRFARAPAWLAKPTQDSHPPVSVACGTRQSLRSNRKGFRWSDDSRLGRIDQSHRSALRKRFAMTKATCGVQQPIIGYHRDDEGHWVAQLACGHNQHVRHDPPLVRRDWVQTEQGRTTMVGFHLSCKKCVEDAPPDDLFSA